MNVGKNQGGVSPGVLFNNLATDAITAAMVPNYVVNWFVPSLGITPTPPAQVTLTWTGTGYNLQTNASLANPAGWGTVPSATSPAVLDAAAGQMFYRLKSP